MENKVVSIIVPVYNVEKFVSRCLDSIIRQSYRNIQIVVVNDGSTDDSRAIVESYARKDERVELFNKENGGLSDARNYALSRCKGDYICFIDSDDWVEQEFIYCLIKQFNENEDVDIAMVDYDYAYDDRFKEREYFMNTGILGKEKALKELCIGKRITNHVWNKMYKKELFQSVYFERGRTFEDVFIMHRLFDKANKISCVSTTGYHYYIRDNSIIHQFSPQNKMDIFIGYKRRYDYLSDRLLKKIVLKFCAASCHDVLFLVDSDTIKQSDVTEAIEFWKKHKEIQYLGLKYFIMYHFPKAYNSVL